MSGNAKRRSRKAEEKLRIVLAGLDGTVEVSELCRREGISPTQYYSWKKQLTNSASQGFADGRKKGSAREERLSAELQRKDSVIAEITAENLALKYSDGIVDSQDASIVIRRLTFRTTNHESCNSLFQSFCTMTACTA